MSHTGRDEVPPLVSKSYSCSSRRYSSLWLRTRLTKVALVGAQKMVPSTTARVCLASSLLRFVLLSLLVVLDHSNRTFHFADAALSIDGAGVGAFVNRLRSAVYVPRSELEEVANVKAPGRGRRKDEEDAANLRGGVKQSTSYDEEHPPVSPSAATCSSTEHGPFCALTAVTPEQKEQAQYLLDGLLFANLSETSLLSNFQRLTNLLFQQTPAESSSGAGADRSLSPLSTSPTGSGSGNLLSTSSDLTTSSRFQTDDSFDSDDLYWEDHDLEGSTAESYQDPALLVECREINLSEFCFRNNQYCDSKVQNGWFFSFGLRKDKAALPMVVTEVKARGVGYLIARNKASAGGREVVKVWEQNIDTIPFSEEEIANDLQFFHTLLSDGFVKISNILSNIEHSSSHRLRSAAAGEGGQKFLNNQGGSTTSQRPLVAATGGDEAVTSGGNVIVERFLDLENLWKEVILGTSAASSTSPNTDPRYAPRLHSKSPLRETERAALLLWEFLDRAAPTLAADFRANMDKELGFAEVFEAGSGEVTAHDAVFSSTPGAAIDHKVEIENQLHGRHGKDSESPPPGSQAYELRQIFQVLKKYRKREGYAQFTPTDTIFPITQLVTFGDLELQSIKACYRLEPTISSDSTVVKKNQLIATSNGFYGSASTTATEHGLSNGLSLALREVYPESDVISLKEAYTKGMRLKHGSTTRAGQADAARDGGKNRGRGSKRSKRNKQSRGAGTTSSATTSNVVDYVDEAAGAGNSKSSSTGQKVNGAVQQDSFFDMYEFLIEELDRIPNLRTVLLQGISFLNLREYVRKEVVGNPQYDQILIQLMVRRRALRFAQGEVGISATSGQFQVRPDGQQVGERAAKGRSSTASSRNRKRRRRKPFHMDQFFNEEASIDYFEHSKAWQKLQNKLHDKMQAQFDELGRRDKNPEQKQNSASSKIRGRVKFFSEVPMQVLSSNSGDGTTSAGSYSDNTGQSPQLYELFSTQQYFYLMEKLLANKKLYQQPEKRKLLEEVLDKYLLLEEGEDRQTKKKDHVFSTSREEQAVDAETSAAGGDAALTNNTTAAMSQPTASVPEVFSLMEKLMEEEVRLLEDEVDEVDLRNSAEKNGNAPSVPLPQEGTAEASRTGTVPAPEDDQATDVLQKRQERPPVTASGTANQEQSTNSDAVSEDPDATSIPERNRSAEQEQHLTAEELRRQDEEFFKQHGSSTTASDFKDLPETGTGDAADNRGPVGHQASGSTGNVKLRDFIQDLVATAREAATTASEGSSARGVAGKGEAGGADESPVTQAQERQEDRSSGETAPTVGSAGEDLPGSRTADESNGADMNTSAGAADQTALPRDENSNPDAPLGRETFGEAPQNGAEARGSADPDSTSLPPVAPPEEQSSAPNLPTPQVGGEANADVPSSPPQEPPEAHLPVGTENAQNAQEQPQMGPSGAPDPNTGNMSTPEAAQQDAGSTETSAEVVNLARTEELPANSTPNNSEQQESTATTPSPPTSREDEEDTEQLRAALAALAEHDETTTTRTAAEEDRGGAPPAGQASRPPQTTGAEGRADDPTAQEQQLPDLFGGDHSRTPQPDQPDAAAGEGRRQDERAGQDTGPGGRPAGTSGDVEIANASVPPQTAADAEDEIAAAPVVSTTTIPPVDPELDYTRHPSILTTPNRFADLLLSADKNDDRAAPASAAETNEGGAKEKSTSELLDKWLRINDFWQEREDLIVGAAEEQKRLEEDRRLAAERLRLWQASLEAEEQERKAAEEKSKAEMESAWAKLVEGISGEDVGKSLDSDAETTTTDTGSTVEVAAAEEDERTTPDQTETATTEVEISSGRSDEHGVHDEPTPQTASPPGSAAGETVSLQSEDEAGSTVALETETEQPPTATPAEVVPVHTRIELERELRRLEAEILSPKSLFEQLAEVPLGDIENNKATSKANQGASSEHSGTTTSENKMKKDSATSGGAEQPRLVFGAVNVDGDTFFTGGSGANSNTKTKGKTSSPPTVQFKLHTGGGGDVLNDDFANQLAEQLSKLFGGGSDQLSGGAGKDSAASRRASSTEEEEEDNADNEITLHKLKPEKKKKASGSGATEQTSASEDHETAHGSTTSGKTDSTEGASGKKKTVEVQRFTVKFDQNGGIDILEMGNNNAGANQGGNEEEAKMMRMMQEQLASMLSDQVSSEQGNKEGKPSKKKDVEDEDELGD
ncbi:unnamed protein product [Amoebophrya sp. A120]|nr:unnamed protein product [Amoebophrya sp. A120]|eukprot:GSA120T00012511001.1